MNNLKRHYHRYFTAEQRAAWTVEQVFNHLWGQIPISENLFEDGTPEATEWAGIVATAARRTVQKYLDLPEAPVVKFGSKRRLQQPTLKLPFSSLHDIRLRLNGTMVFIGSTLYLVRDIFDVDGDFLMKLEDKDGKKFRSWYHRGDVDLRSLEPQYVTVSNVPGFVFRPPGRIQRQGMCNENLLFKHVGQSQDNAHRLDSYHELMKGLSTDINPWSPAFSSLMVKMRALPALRLSKNVAFFTDKDKVRAEYKGRLLGEVYDDVVMLDEDDYRRPWIRDAVLQVGCTAKEAR